MRWKVLLLSRFNIDGPDAEYPQLDTDLVTFEKIKLASDWKYFKFLQSLERIDHFKSDEIGPNPIFAVDPWFDAPGSGLSSAFLIRGTRHTRERIKRFL